MAAVSPIEGRLPQALQCPICLETLRRPKVLPCGHTYCASCLQSHIDSKMIKKGTSQVYFPCPVCRVDTTLPDTTISVEQWAEAFPVNSIVSSVLDVAGKMHGDKLCDICQKWNIQSTAVSFCKDCQRLMCKICREHHNESHSQIRHDVIDTNSENTSCITVPNLSIIEICPRHHKKNIEFFCRDHSSLCCSTCGFLEHRKCERVITIEDMFKTFDVRTKSKDLEANLLNIGCHLKQMTSKVKENADSIKTDKSVILQQIRNIKSDLNVGLQKLEDDLIASLEGNHKSEVLNLQNQEARCHSLITAIENDLTQYDLVMTHGTESQKVIVFHNMEKNQNRYLKVMSEYKENIKDIRIGLDINIRLKDLIKELNGFGLIKVTRTKHDFPSCLIVTPSQENVEVVSESTGTPLKDRKAVKVSEFNVKVGEDIYSCHITDILILPLTKYIIADYGNSKIKVYREHYQFQESMTLQGKPWNACILPDNDIAVTVPNIKTILIVGINDKMHKVREIRTRLHPWGIAVVKDQFVITTYADDSSVLILDMTGTEIRTVRPDNYQSQKLLHPWYAKINKSETILYISYSSGNKMVAYNTSWNILFTYTDQDMTHPDGIDTDREGNIYLCGYTSFNIQLLSADGKLIKTLITKKEDRMQPRTLRFYRDMERFVVTYCNCDIVEVYDMRD